MPTSTKWVRKFHFHNTEVCFLFIFVSLLSVAVVNILPTSRQRAFTPRFKEQAYPLPILDLEETHQVSILDKSPPLRRPATGSSSGAGPQHRRRLPVQAIEDFFGGGPTEAKSSARLRPCAARDCTGSGRAGSPQLGRRLLSAPTLGGGGVGGFPRARAFLSATVSAAPLGAESPQGRISGMETQTHPPWRNARRWPARLSWREATRGRRVISRRCLQRSDGDLRPDAA